MRRYIILSLLLASLTNMHAQESWTLQQCINYAHEHSISIKLSANVKEQRALDVSTAKNARLPSLNGIATDDFSNSRMPNLNANTLLDVIFNRDLDADNIYTNRNSNNFKVGLSTSVPLLTGMKIPNQLKLAKLNLEAATADLEKAKNDVSLQVAQYFINVVYDRELLGVANRQISIDSLQVYRLQEMQKSGKVSPVEVSQQEATLSQSRLKATNAANTLKLAVLDLTQILELSSPEGFSVTAPSLENFHMDNSDLVSPDVIYAEALNIKPEIEAEQLRLKGSEYSINIAKAANYPKLDLVGSLGSNFFKASGINSRGFFYQMKDNFSKAVGLSLTIPIFNRFATLNSIRSAKIDRQNQQLTLDKAKKTLYKEIQQVYYNTLAASTTYQSCIAAAQSAEDAFELMRAKYEAGKAVITEFNESKNNLMNALSDLTRAKYMYLYQIALTNFYRGKPLSL